MTAKVASLWRHPIKSHGRESIETVALEAGKTMPWDRHWAVAHDKSKFDADARDWVACGNFMRGMTVPSLNGIWASYDEATGQLTLRHQSLEDVTFDPETPEGQSAFFDWAAPLYPSSGRQPAALVSANDRGMTDSSTASLSIMNHASHEAVEHAHGGPLDIARWRGNIWLNSPNPWDELNWVSKDIKIGQVRFHIRKPIERCPLIMANPRTGERDADLLKTLRDTWNHEDFGMQAVVVEGGQISVGDTVEVL